MKVFLAICIAFLALAGSPAHVYATQCGKTDPEILVVYWTARDCTWCTYWESRISGMQHGFEKSAEFQKLIFRVVKRPRIDTPPVASDYPEDLAWLRERIEKQPQAFRLGVPAWNVYINRKRVAGFAGTQTWNDKILPAIKKIVNETCPS